MIALQFALSRTQQLDVLCIGAHCDDIEIGCGATLLALQQHRRGLRIHWLVLTSVPERRDEVAAAFNDFVAPASRGSLRICGLRDGYLPASFSAAKSEFESMKTVVDPQVVFTHHGLDRHQDHALSSQLTWQTFRNHMILEYEIPKYDGDLKTPNIYVPLTDSLARQKVEMIVRNYASQGTKPWFRKEALLAIMQLRGIEGRAVSGFAEAFHGRKLIHQLAFGDDAPADDSRVGTGDEQPHGSDSF